MARKTKIVHITDGNRDHGRKFLITEMDADRAESWALRLLLALAKSGVEVPDDIMNAGFAGVAALGVRSLAGLNYADAGPLLDEMMACVQIIPDPARPEFVRGLLPGDIEEIKTRLQLRAETIRLHLSFLPAVAAQATPQATAAQQ